MLLCMLFVLTSICCYVSQLEAEIRTHYEVENARCCAKWKQFHLQISDRHNQLLEQIDRQCRGLAQSLGVSFQPPEQKQQSNEHQLSSPVEGQLTLDAISNQENELRMRLASDWIQQERFNIQEAFTNQTRKIHEDFQTFMDQLDAAFAAERQKILANADDNQAKHKAPQRQTASSRLLNRQFKNNYKLEMLVHTAPVVKLHAENNPVTDLLRQAYPKSKTSHLDVHETQRCLDALQARLHTLQEVSDA